MQFAFDASVFLLLVFRASNSVVIRHFLDTANAGCNAVCIEVGCKERLFHQKKEKKTSKRIPPGLFILAGVPCLFQN